MDLIPILLGSLPLAHNAQHSLVITRNAHGAEEGEGLAPAWERGYILAREVDTILR